jgi:hypothetical protein
LVKKAKRQKGKKALDESQFCNRIFNFSLFWLQMKPFRKKVLTFAPAIEAQLGYA